jgi:hypothetical protein
MRHADLDDSGARAADFHHELGVDHRPDTLEVQTVEQMPTEQLEGAVDIAHRNVEEAPYE